MSGGRCVCGEKNIQKSLPVDISCEHQRWASSIHCSSKTFINISLATIIHCVKSSDSRVTMSWREGVWIWIIFTVNGSRWTLAWGCLFGALGKLWALGYMILHLCDSLNTGVCTVFVTVHSLSFHINWAEMYPHMRWCVWLCSVDD